MVDQAKGNSDTSAAESGSEAEETTTPRRSTSLPNRILDRVEEEVIHSMMIFYSFAFLWALLCSVPQSRAKI